MKLAVVDASALYAAADADDTHHERCLSVLGRADLHLVIAALPLAEALYLVGRRLGARAEAAFLRGLKTYDVEAPAPADWERISELVERYEDFPLGGTDASVLALAERLGTPTVVTLDHRHFGALRPAHADSLELLPA